MGAQPNDNNASSVARAYPDNVLGVYIRDVTTTKGITDPLEDPVGLKALSVKAEVEEQFAGSSTTSLQSGSRRGTLSTTPRRTSSSFSSVLSFRSGSTTGQKGPQSEIGEGVYFDKSHATLTAEPKTMAGSSDDVQTPTADDRLATLAAGLRMTTMTPSGALNNSKGANENPVITQAPKPTPPPSIQRRPTPNAITSPTSTRAQRRGTAGSSASDSDSNMELDARLVPRMSSVGSVSSVGSGSTLGTGAVMSQLTIPTVGLSLEERKRSELQMRVWKARLAMPNRVKLRVFKDPRECEEETDEILQREMLC